MASVLLIYCFALLSSISWPRAFCVIAGTHCTARTHTLARRTRTHFQLLLLYSRVNIVEQLICQWVCDWLQSKRPTSTVHGCFCAVISHRTELSERIKCADPCSYLLICVGSVFTPIHTRIKYINESRCCLLITAQSFGERSSDINYTRNRALSVQCVFQPYFKSNFVSIRFKNLFQV